MYSVLPEKDLAKYESRLFHMIDEQRIICTEIPRTPKEIKDQFLSIKGLSSAVSDALDQQGIQAAVSASVIKPLPGQIDCAAVGNVVTLRFVPERVTVSKAIAENMKGKTASRDVFALTQEGDFYIVDLNGAEISGCGGMAATMAKEYGLAGMVIDGGIRDVPEIRALNLPTWSRHITPITCKHRVEAITINGPVMVDNVQVNPGDLCVADDTGICFIPAELVEQVLEICLSTIEKEDKVLKLLKSGASVKDMVDVMPADKW
jgi:regulator of RNase E activity RraA